MSASRAHPPEPSARAGVVAEHRATRPLRRRVESHVWTGPIGHALGGALDLAQGTGRYWLARARRARGSRSNGG